MSSPFVTKISAQHGSIYIYIGTNCWRFARTFRHKVFIYLFALSIMDVVLKLPYPGQHTHDGITSRAYAPQNRLTLTSCTRDRTPIGWPARTFDTRWSCGGHDRQCSLWNLHAYTRDRKYKAEFSSTFGVTCFTRTCHDGGYPYLCQIWLGVWNFLGLASTTSGCRNCRAAQHDSVNRAHSCEIPTIAFIVSMRVKQMSHTAWPRRRPSKFSSGMMIPMNRNMSYMLQYRNWCN